MKINTGGLFFNELRYNKDIIGLSVNIGNNVNDGNVGYWTKGNEKDTIKFKWNFK